MVFYGLEQEMVYVDLMEKISKTLIKLYMVYVAEKLRNFTLIIMMGY